MMYPQDQSKIEENLQSWREWAAKMKFLAEVHAEIDAKKPKKDEDEP